MCDPNVLLLLLELDKEMSSSSSSSSDSSEEEEFLLAEQYFLRNQHKVEKPKVQNYIDVIHQYSDEEASIN